MNDATRQALVAERLDTVRRMIASRGAPAALLRARRNFAWATVGGENHVVLSTEEGVAALLVTASDAIVVTSVIEAARIAEEELANLPIRVEGVPWHEAGAMDRNAERLAGGRPLGDAELEADLIGVRCILAAPEAERLAWLSQRAAAALRSALDDVIVGTVEHEAAAKVAGRLGVDGIRAPVLLAAADDRIERHRHPLPTSHVVAHRLMLVVVAERWGLHAATTRFVELDPPDDERSRRIEAVARIHDAMVAATRAGETLGSVLSVAQQAYAAVGHPEEWTLHHQGGVIGYQGRERIAVPSDPTVIREGMAFAWNPSVTGAKAEETILLGADGPRSLTSQ